IAEAATAVAYAELKSAKETLRFSILNADRRRKSGASPLEIDKAETELKQAEIGLEAKQALVKLAETQMQLERARMERMEEAQKSGNAIRPPAIPGSPTTPASDPNLQKMEAEARVRQAETFALVMRAELKAAEANLKAAHLKLEHLNKLVADKLVSAAE